MTILLSSSTASTSASDSPPSLSLPNMTFKKGMRIAKSDYEASERSLIK